MPGRVAVDDFNRDGKPDMAVTSPDSRYLAVFLGDGTGNFGTPSILPTGIFSVPVATGDFNGDGNPDLAVGISDTSALHVSRRMAVWI
ncbi:MAG: FG-GAP repeat domain-containing protein [Pyrinomonadaceae bacterium]